MSDEPTLPSHSASDASSDDASPDSTRRTTSEEDRSGRAKLPSKGEDADRAASPRLPSREGKTNADGHLPSHTPPATSTPPAQKPSGSRQGKGPSNSGDESLEALIQRLTENKDIGDSVPSGYEHPGEHWKSITHDDPFTPLLLDPAQYENITEVDVDNHFHVVRKFWETKVNRMESGGARRIPKLYGGPDESKERVRGYLDHVRRCRDQIIDSADLQREAERLLHEREEEAWQDLQDKIDIAVRGSEIQPNQVQSLLDVAEKRGMARDEARKRLSRRFEEEGFEKVVEDGQPTYWTSPNAQTRQEKAREAEVPPLTIGDRSVKTIKDLIDVCDENLDAARKNLRNGYIDRWIGGNLGDTELANKVARIRDSHTVGAEQMIGLELALRTLCESVGRPSLPDLQLSHQSLDFGTQEFAQRLKAKVTVQNASQRRAWGTIRKRGNLPGLQVDDRLDLGDTEIQTSLDTTQVQPGEYAGQVLLDIAGAPDTHKINVRYRVEPVKLRFEPETLHLGPIVSSTHTATLSVVTKPEHAIEYLDVSWAKTWDPATQATEARGDEWTPAEATFDRSEKRLEVSVRAKEVRDRRSYDNAIAFALPNEQAEQVPFSFRRPWKHMTPVSMIIGAILFGTLFGSARQALQRYAQPFEGWMLIPSFHGNTILIATAFVLVSVLLVLLPVGLSLWRDKRVASNS